MKNTGAFTDLDDRARDIFRHIVDTYMVSGEPVGSRTLSKSFDLSPASIRNVMADLEDLGLLRAPHVSAGRMPTDLGLRYFIDGILEVGSLSSAERAAMEAECITDGSDIGSVLEQAGRIMSGVSASASIVVAPKADKPIRQIEFVTVDPTRALVVIVPEDGIVENRIMPLPPGMTADMLKRAGAFLSERLYGKTIAEMRSVIIEEIRARQSELGELTTRIIEDGLAVQSGDGKLIVRGSANLLSPDALNDLERIRALMQQLESKETVQKLLGEASNAGGVKIYIGTENPVFRTSGHTMILTPYTNGTNRVVGAIGVIGPTRLDYARIIPSINVMADIISRKIRALGDGPFADKA
jgi:heat-inducible transcriptional repressor